MNRANRSSWLAAIGIVVAIVALWRPGVLVSSGAGYRLALNLPEWLVFPLAVAALTMCVAVITPRRKGVVAIEPPRRLSPAGILVLFLLLAGAISAMRLATPGILTLLQHGHGAAWSLPQVMDNPAAERDAINVPAVDTGLTIVLVVLAALVTGFALLVIGVSEPWAVIAEWLRLRRGEQAPAGQELASAISAGMSELESGDDPRSAVIACYRRCEAALAAQRRRRYLSETPREFMRGALAALALPANAVRALLLVFERARFSDLAVTEVDRSVALDALGEIRSVLEGRSEHGSRA